MANKEIGDLTAATTPLGGTETAHIVQSSNSRRTTIDDIGTRVVTANKTSTSDYRAKTTGKIIDTDGAWGAMAEVTLTDGASISLDLDTGFDFAVTLAGNRTLSNATNVQVGQKGRIRVVQDATGSRTLSFGSNYEFAGGSAPTLTTTANAQDVLYYDCISATRILVTSVLDIS